jgi:hypothetical protein
MPNPSEVLSSGQQDCSRPIYFLVNVYFTISDPFQLDLQLLNYKPMYLAILLHLALVLFKKLFIHMREHGIK